MRFKHVKSLVVCFLKGEKNVERVDESQIYVVDVYVNHRMSHLKAFKKFVHSKQNWDI